jgi:hypothetical protein
VVHVDERQADRVALWPIAKEYHAAMLHHLMASPTHCNQVREFVRRNVVVILAGKIAEQPEWPDVMHMKGGTVPMSTLPTQLARIVIAPQGRLSLFFPVQAAISAIAPAPARRFGSPILADIPSALALVIAILALISLRLPSLALQFLATRRTRNRYQIFRSRMCRHPAVVALMITVMQLLSLCMRANAVNLLPALRTCYRFALEVAASVFKHALWRAILLLPFARRLDYQFFLAVCAVNNRTRFGSRCCQVFAIALSAAKNVDAFGVETLALNGFPTRCTLRDLHCLQLLCSPNGMYIIPLNSALRNRTR